MSDTDFHDDVTIRSLSDIVPYGENPKEHPQEQVDKIASSIQRFGWDQPIVVDGANTIIKGHGRYQAAQKLGLDDVPVIEQPDLSEAEARAARIADNRVAESEWDDDLLAAELELLDESPVEKELTGFDNTEIDEVLTEIDEGLNSDRLESEPLADKDLADVKILNLYAGIGGNRKLWGDEPDVTAVEYNDTIAEAYSDFFPEDTVVVDDAHEYLLNHFDEFDFIWTSPPCPTHSQMRKNFSVPNGAEVKYPDLKLYEEILLLKGYFEGQWVVENVEPWYEPLVEPQHSDRHMFWSNFDIPEMDDVDRNAVLTAEEFDAKAHQESFGYDLSEHSFSSDYPKEKVLKNMVHPEVGKAILESAIEDGITAE